MKQQELFESIKGFWGELKHEKTAIAGLALLFLFILIMCFESFIVPFPAVSRAWRDIQYWEDNPRAVPPAWVDFFTRTKYTNTVKFTGLTSTLETRQAMRIMEVAVPYEYNGDIPPTDILFSCTTTGSPVIILTLKRPDGLSVELLRKAVNTSTGKKKERISVDKDGRESTFRFGFTYDRGVDRSMEHMVYPTELLFAHTGPDIFTNPTPLHGTYTLEGELLLLTPADNVEDISLIFPGSVSGLLGTDNAKRDIWSGLVSGVKWALLIGLLTALLAVSFGVVYGVMSAYLGGWKDSLMQRIFEIFLSIPLLPLLIVMSAVFKPSIVTLIFMMSCFFWTGPVKTVRSIGLQIKEEVYIEASRGVGASDFRIIFTHMIPLLLPYAFASMALYVPGAIVYESSISLLGLGDSTIVTWGQILHDALAGGAVINGQWWWVIPPGIAIAVMSMTFAFIGFAMDRLLHPTLRTR